MNAADVTHWLPLAAGFGLARPMLKAGKGALAERGAVLEKIVAATPTTTHYGEG